MRFFHWQIDQEWPSYPQNTINLRLQSNLSSWTDFMDIYFVWFTKTLSSPDEDSMPLQRSVIVFGYAVDTLWSTIYKFVEWWWRPCGLHWKCRSCANTCCSEIGDERCPTWSNFNMDQLYPAGWKRLFKSVLCDEEFVRISNVFDFQDLHLDFSTKKASPLHRVCRWPDAW